MNWWIVPRRCDLSRLGQELHWQHIFVPLTCGSAFPHSPEITPSQRLENPNVSNRWCPNFACHENKGELCYILLEVALGPQGPENKPYPRDCQRVAVFEAVRSANLSWWGRHEGSAFSTSLFREGNAIWPCLATLIHVLECFDCFRFWYKRVVHMQYPSTTLASSHFSNDCVDLFLASWS